MSNTMFAATAPATMFNNAAPATIKCVLLTTCGERYGINCMAKNALTVYTLQQLQRSQEDYDSDNMEECVQDIQVDKLVVVKRKMDSGRELFTRNVYKHIETGQMFITLEEYNLAHDGTVQKLGNF